MPLFDTYLMVDWSAASQPASGKDSIWIALHDGRSEAGLVTPENPRTRAAAFERIQSWLAQLVREQRRVLVSFDFPYGYPRGFAEKLGHVRGSQGSQPWRHVWDYLGSALEDATDNSNNRFALAGKINAHLGGCGPFWGCPASKECESLKPRKTGHSYVGLERLRKTEKEIRGVQECWKLAYTGSVGSQNLTGIPRLRALRDDEQLRAVSRVWPFETRFSAALDAGARPYILHAEIWPGVPQARTLIELARTANPDLPRDAAQVLGMAAWAAQEDENGNLERLLDCPPDLAEADREAAILEEGWILGGQAAR